MHENHSLVFGKNKIGTTRKFRLEQVPEAESVKTATKYPFRFGIRTPNDGHQFGTACPRERVGHWTSPSYGSSVIAPLLAVDTRRMYFAIKPRV